jgi:putative resolvase
MDRARLQGIYPQTAYRLGRMNTELVEAALSVHGRRLVLLDPAEADDDLAFGLAGAEGCTYWIATAGGRASVQRAAASARAFSDAPRKPGS